MSQDLKVLVIGAGGREHAIVKTCLDSPLCKSVIAAPGNGGIAQEATCFPVDVEDANAMAELAVAEGANFVIVGPEVPLCAGVVDALAEKGIPAYGPNAKAAQFEGSKSFTKDFLQKYNIPTAAYKTFTDSVQALEYLNTLKKPPVIKASGLAAGKGVLIPLSMEEAAQGITDILDKRIFGESGASLVIEEFLDGEEASLHVMVSGSSYTVLPFSRDHKRAGEGDTGPNTGGMGAFCPAQGISDSLMETIESTIIQPTIDGFLSEDIDYRGTLYIGLMLDDKGPKVLEFNVRFGDPETQILLPVLADDPLQLMVDSAAGNPLPKKLKLKDSTAAIVVLAAQGYPDSYPKGDTITVSNNVPENVSVIHAGTKQLEDGTIVTNGGRVLGVTALAPTLEDALALAYKGCKEVHFENCYFRKDIGHSISN